ncbi:hypothetical protein D3C76_274920 [compost metagenome]
MQWRGRVAGGVLGDEGQGLAVDLRSVQVEHEGAVRVDCHLAKQVAIVVYHGDAGAGFTGTNQLGAAVVDHGDHCGWRGNVSCGGRADRRDVAARIGQGHLQHLPVKLRRAQVDHELAVGTDLDGADLGDADVDANGSARFADAAELVARHVEPQLGRRRWWCEVGRQDVDRRTDVAGWVGLLYRQRFVVDLRGCQLDAEAAVGLHGAKAQHGARSVAHGDGCPGFAQAGHHAAVDTDVDLGKRSGRGEVWGLQGGHRRYVAGSVGLGEAEQLAVTQRRGEGDGEMPAGVDRGPADFVAIRRGDDDLCPNLAAAGEGDAIAGDGKLGWCGWWRGVGRGDGTGIRLVAGGIDQHHLHLLAVGLRRTEVYLEAAVATHDRGAEHAAIGSQHADSGARFAGTVEQAAAPGEGQVLGGIGCHAIRRGEADAVGLVAGNIGLAGAELFAVDLRAAKANAEVAIGIDQTGAEIDAAFTDHGNGGTRLAAATEHQPVAGQHDIGQRQRCGGVGRLQAGRQRRAAVGAYGADLQHFAVGLGATEVDREGAVVGDGGGTQQYAIGAIHVHCAAWGCRAGHCQAIGSQYQVVGCIWRQHARCGDGLRRRNVLRGIGLHHAEAFAGNGSR